MKGLEGKNKKLVISIPVVLAIAIVVGICIYLGSSNTNISSKWLKNGKGLSADSETDGSEINNPVAEGSNEGENAAVQEGTVTVYYVDEEGNILPETEPVVKTGKIGEWYEVERLEIPKYTKAGEEPLTRAGYYEMGNKDVKFIYKSAGEEVAFKVSNEGEDGATETELDVVFNNTRKTTDYGIKVITKDESGNVLNGGKFTISKENVEIGAGEVTNGMLYFGKIAVGKDGNIEYGLEQTKATVGYKKVSGIVGLTLVSEWTDNKFVVTGVSTNVEGTRAYIDEETNEIVIEFTNEKVTDMYEMELVYSDKKELLSGARIKVLSKDEVVVEDEVEEGKLEIGEFEVTEVGTDVYEIYETAGVEGYTQVLSSETAVKVAVSKTFNHESEAYDVTASTNSTNGVSVKAEGNKVTVYVKVEKIPEEEPTPENPTEPEKPQEPDVYDLAMMKFISEIDGKETQGREPVITVAKASNEKNTSNTQNKVTASSEKTVEFTYTKKSDMEQVANGQEVTYRLRMYNESERNGKGKSIIEDIPNGLVFLPENETNKKYGWVGYVRDSDGDLVKAQDIKKATVFVSDYLVDKEIAGYNTDAVNKAVANNSAEGSIAGYLNFQDVEIVLAVDEDKITSENRVIENTVTIQKNDNDDNTDNDTTTEKVYVKYFDLDVTKYIEEIKVKNEKEDKTQKIGESKKGKTIKIDVAKSQVANTTITVTYGLKVTNIGQIEGYATELVDYIPEDFTLVQDGIWKVDGNKAVTSKLENKLLQPGESATVNITFEWKLSENNIGSRINEGKITKYENPYDAIDRTNDNNDKEEMLVAVRTGGITYIIPAAIVLAIASIGVYTIMKRKNREEGNVNE